LAARALGERAFRIARSFRFVVRLDRDVDLRVDFRDGRPFAALSNAAPPFLAARVDRLREPVPLPSPAFRSVALTPGRAVSTGTSRRGRDAAIAFPGPDRSALLKNCCAFVAIAPLLLFDQDPRTAPGSTRLTAISVGTMILGPLYGGLE
jgi:hypothetical protein